MKRISKVVVIITFLFPLCWIDSIPECEQSDKKPAKSETENSYMILERSGVQAVIVNNDPVDNEVLPGHRGGYSGVASLTHDKQSGNLFVPAYAGLNFEHIHDGTVHPREILFEPRNAPMEIKRIDDNTVELHQPPTPHWKLESRLQYTMLDDGVIELDFDCVAHERTFANGYIGLFFASYIHQPESLDIHFSGCPSVRQQAEPHWIRGITPEHGVLSTHKRSVMTENLDMIRIFPLHWFLTTPSTATVNRGITESVTVWR